jgi:hypothetical protein
VIFLVSQQDAAVTSTAARLAVEQQRTRLRLICKSIEIPGQVATPEAVVKGKGRVFKAQLLSGTTSLTTSAPTKPAGSLSDAGEQK